MSYSKQTYKFFDNSNKQTKMICNHIDQYPWFENISPYLTEIELNNCWRVTEKNMSNKILHHNSESYYRYQNSIKDNRKSSRKRRYPGDFIFISNIDIDQTVSSLSCSTTNKTDENFKKRIQFTTNVNQPSIDNIVELCKQGLLSPHCKHTDQQFHKGPCYIWLSRNQPENTHGHGRDQGIQFYDNRLFYLVNLKHLKLSLEFLDISWVIKCIELKFLITLHLENCDLTTIPPSLYLLLGFVEVLSFANNPELEYISPFILELTYLKKFNVSNTNVKKIPNSIILLTRLEELNVSNCPLKYFPKVYEPLLKFDITGTNIFRRKRPLAFKIKNYPRKVPSLQLLIVDHIFIRTRKRFIASLALQVPKYILNSLPDFNICCGCHRISQSELGCVTYTSYKNNRAVIYGEDTPPHIFDVKLYIHLCSISCVYEFMNIYFSKS